MSQNLDQKSASNRSRSFEKITYVAVIRLAMALALLGSVYWQVSDRLIHNVFRPFEYFTYFTVTSCIATGVILVVSAVNILRGQTESKRMSLMRLTMAASMVVVGVIYNLLLAGSAPDVRDANYAWPVLPNLILHNYMPVVVLIEYLVVATAVHQKLTRAFWVLVYPLGWLAFTIIRGISTNWWPYPFLDPANGIPNMLKWIGIISAFFIVLALSLMPLQRVIAGIWTKK